MTAWGSLRFDAIFSIIVSVDSNALKVLSEKWEDAAGLIKKHASTLEDETERLHRQWKSPKAADAFQERVAGSVRRMREWAREAGSAGRAGTLKQAAVEVARSQAEMRRLKAARDAELAAAQPEQRAAIEEKYDRLARAEGGQLGGAVAKLTPWRPPEPYTGLSGLSAQHGDQSGFVQTFGVTDESTEDGTQPPAPHSEPTALQPEPEVRGPMPMPVPVVPLIPPLARPVEANPATAAGGRGWGLRATTTPSGFLPNGLFGRLLGATPALNGMLPSATVTAGTMIPPVPPAGHPGATVGGRRLRRRRRAEYQENIEPVTGRAAPPPEDDSPVVQTRAPATANDDKVRNV